MRFSEGTLSRLTAASWWPGRKYDAARYVALLASKDFTVHAAAVGFLEEFGEIFVDCKPSRYTAKPTTMHFNVKMAAGRMKYCPPDNEFVIRKELCVVGRCWGQSARIYMSKDGSFYVSGQDDLWLAGNSTEDFLERLCMGKDLMESDFQWD